MENIGSNNNVINDINDTSSVEESQNLTSSVKKFDLSEVERHSSADDCWVVYGRNVYDVTDFLDSHPGGADFILREGGTDIAAVFQDENVHGHSAAAYNVLQEYKVGELKGELLDGEQSEYSNQMTGFKEELVDWNRGMVAQVHKFGPDYLEWVHSPVNKKLKMFDNDFIEWFSVNRWEVIPIVWIPFVLLAAVLAFGEFSDSTTTTNTTSIAKPIASLFVDPFSQSSALFSTLKFFACGFLLWSILEYLLHRFLFHLEPASDSDFQITMHFFFHGLHHKVPFDTGRLVFPPMVAGVLAGILLYALQTLFPPGVSTAMFAGILLGYVCYDLMHYYMHHGNPPEGSYLQSMKSYHSMHHFHDHNLGYGITSKVWDYFFQTELVGPK